MPSDPRLQQLLEEILDSGKSPQVVARDCPELLPEVLDQLSRLRAVEAQVDALFPESSGMPPTLPESMLTAGKLPRLPGYELESVLGRGGMGVVYKGRRLQLNRPVAIKMLLAGTCATAAERERFLREAEAAARLQHPNIVQVYDVGDYEGQLYFTMEFVDGGTLADDLAGMPLAPREAAQLLSTLADAVRVAHEAKIIHRDLKPSNVLLTAEGTPKISDFGLARQLEERAGLTLTGSPLGTPSYMSPEQARGDLHSLGPHVDIYALGAMLYELLTGRPPFRAESSPETLRQVISQEPVSPKRLNASVPRDLETICLKCLQKDPVRRYAGAGALRDDIQRFLRKEPIVARPISLVGRAYRWVRRNPVGAGLLLTAVGLVVVSTVFGMKERTLASERRLERAAWQERLQLVLQLEQEGRFREARAILGRVPDGGSGHLRGDIETAIRDLDIADQLEGVRMTRGRFNQGGGIDYDEASRQYEKIFRDNGLGTLEENPGVVAERLRTSTARRALLAALDDWAVCARDGPRPWIFDVARGMDPDPWRDRVRTVAHWADKNELQRLAEEANVIEQPVSLLIAMGTRWRLVGGDPSQFLQHVYQVYPDDFWLNFELGLATPEPAAAMSYNRAALALRPDAPAAHYNLGMNLIGLQRYEEGIYHLRRTLESDADHTWAHFNLAELLLVTGELDEAYLEFQRTLKLEPESLASKIRMREILIRQGRVEEGAASWAEAFYSDASTYRECDGYAEFCLIVGREEEYRRACARMLARFGATAEPRECEVLGRACCLGPTSAEQLQQGMALIDRALAADASTDDWLIPYLLFAKALGDYRSGRYEQAISICEGEAASVLGPAPEYVRALAQHQLGNASAARRALDEASDEFTGEGDPVSDRQNWLYHILRREALDQVELSGP